MINLKIHFYCTSNISPTRWSDPKFWFFEKFLLTVITRDAVTKKLKVHDSLENYCYCVKCLKCWPFVQYYFQIEISSSPWSNRFRQMTISTNDEVEPKCRSPAEYNIRPEKSHQQSLNGIQNDSNVTFDMSQVTTYGTSGDT